MKSTTSILAIVVTLLPLTQAWPTTQQQQTSGGESEFLGSIQYPCGDDVENWVINVGFGTPEQTLPVLIDTTSEETFVNGVMCKTDFCLNQKRFDAGKSTDITNLHQTRTLVFQDEELSVEGHEYMDTLDFAGSMQLDNFAFIKAYTTSGFEPSNFAGSFGLGLPASFLSNGSSSSLEKRRRANNRGSSYYSGERSTNSQQRGSSKRNNERVCELDFGVDHNKISGDIAWLDIPTCDYGKSPFWKTPLTCAKFGDAVDLKFENTLASFDSGVKNIEVPRDDLLKIYEGLNATKCDDDSYEFKCCNAPDLTLSFEKYDVAIPSDVWTTQKDSSGELCTAKISESTSTDEPTNRWHLGTSFTINFYTIFSPSRAQTGLGLSVGGSPHGVAIKSK